MAASGNDVDALTARVTALEATTQALQERNLQLEQTVQVCCAAIDSQHGNFCAKISRGRGVSHCNLTGTRRTTGQWYQ
jgi:hypothetical protein